MGTMGRRILMYRIHKGDRFKPYKVHTSKTQHSQGPPSFRISITALCVCVWDYGEVYALSDLQKHVEFLILFLSSFRFGSLFDVLCEVQVEFCVQLLRHARQTPFLLKCHTMWNGANFRTTCTLSRPTIHILLLIVP